MQSRHTPFPTVQVVIVFHSGLGHTRVLAEQVSRGARAVPGVQAMTLPVEEVEANWEQLDNADAIVFGTPTYMAGVSAPFKAFMDATASRWADQDWRSKLAAGFTNSAGLNGDKLNTLEHLALFAAQHSMVWVPLGLLPGATSSTPEPEALNRMASFMGAMAQSPTDLGPDQAPNKPDQETAAHLGGQVARAALGWRRQASSDQDKARTAIAETLGAYFDGLYHSDANLLQDVFHPEARYVDACLEEIKPITMAEYLPLVAERESPSSRSEARTDRILSIEFAGDSAAIARVSCSIGSRAYIDLLTLVRQRNQWCIISKVFHRTSQSV